MRRWRRARSHFFRGALLGLVSGVFLAGAGCKAPTNAQAGTARSALEAQAHKPTTLPHARRATEEEVRARAALMNGGVPPTPPTAADMELIFSDASSTDRGRRVVALQRFHQAMRSLGTASERKAAGERMRAITAIRAGASFNRMRAP